MIVAALILPQPAVALPSFARQTGEACTSCHVQTWGADLTPRGRDFKLNGYTEGDASRLPPFSVTVDGTVAAQVNPNRSAISPANSAYKASLYYAGRIAPHLGAYASGSYQNVNDELDEYYLDKFDLRFANAVELGGHRLNYGLTANNQPGLQDLWNTTPAWSFTRAVPLSRSFHPSGSSTPPFGLGGRYEFHVWESLLPTGTRVGRNPTLFRVGDLRRGFNRMAPTLMDGVLAGNSGGASAYFMLDRWLYLEGGAYASLPRDVQDGIGRGYPLQSRSVFFNQPDPQLDGGAPYWRVAVQHQWGGHYVSIGHFGLAASWKARRSLGGLTPELLVVRPTSDRIDVTDLGVDATYQYLANPDHIFELKGVYLRERREGRVGTSLLSVFGPVSTSPASPLTEVVRINAAYTWAQTVGIAFGYHRYMDDPVEVSFLSPFAYRVVRGELQVRDREAYVAELAFTPFGKNDSLAAPWLNLRLNLTYMGDLHHSNRIGDTFYVNGSVAF
ncbi:MAG: hypothetical protein FIA97_09220 [Methylococcaceae bacterium]|nr:hypothetical protein [Methylococcaceae bacterium]